MGDEGRNALLDQSSQDLPQECGLLQNGQLQKQHLRALQTEDFCVFRQKPGRKVDLTAPLQGQFPGTGLPQCRKGDLPPRKKSFHRLVFAVKMAGQRDTIHALNGGALQQGYGIGKRLGAVVHAGQNVGMQIRHRFILFWP